MREAFLRAHVPVAPKLSHALRNILAFGFPACVSTSPTSPALCSKLAQALFLTRLNHFIKHVRHVVGSVRRFNPADVALLLHLENKTPTRAERCSSPPPTAVASRGAGAQLRLPQPVAIAQAGLPPVQAGAPPAVRVHKGGLMRVERSSCAVELQSRTGLPPSSTRSQIKAASHHPTR